MSNAPTRFAQIDQVMPVAVVAGQRRDASKDKTAPRPCMNAETHLRVLVSIMLTEKLLGTFILKDTRSWRGHGWKQSVKGIRPCVSWFMPF